MFSSLRNQPPEPFHLAAPKRPDSLNTSPRRPRHPRCVRHESARLTRATLRRVCPSAPVYFISLVCSRGLSCCSRCWNFSPSLGEQFPFMCMPRFIHPCVCGWAVERLPPLDSRGWRRSGRGRTRAPCEALLPALVRTHPDGGLPGQGGTTGFLRALHTVRQGSCTTLHPPRRTSWFSAPLQTLGFSFSFHSTHLSGYAVIPHCGSDLRFPHLVMWCNCSCAYRPSLS